MKIARCSNFLKCTRSCTGPAGYTGRPHQKAFHTCVAANSVIPWCAVVFVLLQSNERFNGNEHTLAYSTCLECTLTLYAAARLVTGSKTSDHISPVLRQLHWLPVRQRVHGVQDSDAVPPVLVRSCPGIPYRWLSACHRRSSKATAFRWPEDNDCPPNLQLLRGQDLCNCGHKSVEQFASWLTKGWVVILLVQEVWWHFYLDSPTIALWHF